MPNRALQPEDLEDLLGDTIVKIGLIHDRQIKQTEQLALIPEIKLVVQQFATAMSVSAEAAQSMSDTYKRAEARQEKLEARYDAAIEAGRGYVPFKIYLWTVAVCLFIVFATAFSRVLDVLGKNGQELKATLTELSINQKRTQAIIGEAKEEVVNKVEEVKSKR